MLRPLGTKARFEKPCKDFFRHAGAVISDDDDDSAAGFAVAILFKSGCDIDISARRHGLHGIFQKVDENLNQITLFP